jgi:hypothetical protein
MKVTSEVRMFGALKKWIKSTPLIDAFIFVKKQFVDPQAQNDETQIIRRLLQRFDVPRAFIEFGFSGWEFNCASLIGEWEGLLIDGNSYNVKIANIVCPSKITAKWSWLTLETMDFVCDYAKSRDVGILSIDVDGNDYWFLEKIIGTKPSIIIVEYNSSFGLRPITVPYDPYFDRTKKHDSWTYFGASLSALNHLANQNGYSLIEVSNSGVNAFFVRRDLLTIDDYELKPESAFREKYFSDGTRPSQQWEKISHLPYVDVTKGG